MKKAPINRLIIEDRVKSFYVKALVEYNNDSEYGLPKRGLSFQIGDILKVTNANDEIWWTAIKLDFTKDNPELSSSETTGLIPSAEKLCKTISSKNNEVEFEKDVVVIQPNGTFTSTKIMSEFGMNASSLTSIEIKKKRLQAQNQSKIVKDKIHKPIYNPTDVYCIVQSENSQYIRPVIIIGPGHGYVYNNLINRNSKKFCSPVNHTTRPKRDYEVDGIDYHFIESKEKFEEEKRNGLFLETAQLRGNWYGTSLLSVRNIIESGYHCLLDATVEIIDRLIEVDIDPISILICVERYDDAVIIYNADNKDSNIIVTDSREKFIKKGIQQASSLNSTYRSSFNAVIWAQNPSVLVEECFKVINNCQRIGVWKPTVDQSFLISS